MAQAAAGVLESKVGTKDNGKDESRNAERFKAFHDEMGPKLTDDVSMNKLIERFSAWQLMSVVYKDSGERCASASASDRV